MNGPPGMPPTDWKASAERVARKLRRCEAALKLAYRKLVLDDPDVGFNEVEEVMCDVLCEAMGDRGFQDWLQAVAPDPRSDER